MEKNGMHCTYKLNQFIGYNSINHMKKCRMSEVFPLAVP